MESRVVPKQRNWTDHKAGQCTPMPPPSIGTLKIVAGNGTSVGTVMTLTCPYRYRASSGGRITCVQESNGTQWNGGTPECKTFPDAEGFRLALLLSIVSIVIIMLMSIYFITSCLLKLVKKEKIRQLERERQRETERLWHQVNAEEQREFFYSHNGRINNNNNNNNNNNSRLEHYPRCHQKNYPDSLTIHHLRPALGQMSPTCPVYNQIHWLSHTTT